MNITPKVEKFGTGNLAWLGSAYGTEHAQTCTLNISKFSSFKDFIPSGTPLKKSEDGGTFEPVTMSGDELEGFLLTDQPLSGMEQVAPYIWHGRILQAYLPANAFDVTTLEKANPAFTIVKKGEL